MQQKNVLMLLGYSLLATTSMSVGMMHLPAKEFLSCYRSPVGGCPPSRSHIRPTTVRSAPTARTAQRGSQNSRAVRLINHIRALCCGQQQH